MSLYLPETWNTDLQHHIMISSLAHFLGCSAFHSKGPILPQESWSKLNVIFMSMLQMIRWAEILTHLR
jgi:hypothetical protein